MRRALELARLGSSTGGLRVPNVRQALPGFAMGSRPAPSGAPTKRTAAESTQESKRRAGLERRSPWYVDPRGARMAAGPPDAGYCGAPQAPSVVVGTPSVPVAAPVKREWKQESASSAEDGQVAEESEEDFGDEPPRSPSDRLPSLHRW
ncbi:hypothetical protein H257_18090 [Aphanomyces astaci]|uniref:Uncharacterized protein n=1 Tax=Aphanomyces astaci TaxID=112090 RepID=W4FCC0_APHAT|nr:hypothetical protein H257_18090 [Aphanomyces astaci]ETV65100.1 hypothetical protein H257_18090 [Aphanomyces astaci]|eukprot:XP_009845403.1 hypothetical protein H257_18090 [Aphanomyces astaci]